MCLKKLENGKAMYTFKSRVRYSEIDENQQLTLYNLMNYFQDTSTFHSESLHRGNEVLQELHCAWVLNSWQICINRFPKYLEDIVVGTWPYEFKGFLGGRNFQISTADGEVLAYANSLWTFLNLDTGIPVRVGSEDLKAYTLEDKLNMEYAPRKVAVPKVYEEKDSFVIKKYHLDTNHHVNNAQYVRFAEEFIPNSKKIRQLRVEYKKQAYLGDVLYPRVSCVDDTYTVALCNKDGEPFAVVEFK